MEKKKKDSTEKRAPKKKPLLPIKLEPPWRETLNVYSFEDGLRECYRNIENAKEQLGQAGIIPGRPRGFLDTKYSATAAQLIYTSYLLLIHGFAAEYSLNKLNWKAVAGSDSEEAIQKAKADFVNTGFIRPSEYRMYLQTAFGNAEAAFFETMNSKFHKDYHYRRYRDRDGFEISLEEYEKHIEDFTKRARKLLAESEEEIKI